MLASMILWNHYYGVNQENRTTTNVLATGISADGEHAVTRTKRLVLCQLPIWDAAGQALPLRWSGSPA